MKPVVNTHACSECILGRGTTAYLLLPVLLVVLPLNLGREVQGGIEDEIGCVFGHVEGEEVEIQTHNTVKDDHGQENSRHSASERKKERHENNAPEHQRVIHSYLPPLYAQVGT